MNNYSEIELAKSRTAITDPEQLKRWLRETGRTYIVLKTDELVDSLSWPRGVESFMSILDAYRSHRRDQVVETTACTLSHTAGTVCRLCSNSGRIVTRTKTEMPEPDEIDAAIYYLNTLKE